MNSTLFDIILQLLCRCLLHLVNVCSFAPYLSRRGPNFRKSAYHKHIDVGTLPWICSVNYSLSD